MEPETTAFSQEIQKILALKTKHLTRREIAEYLGLSPRQVKRRLERYYRLVKQKGQQALAVSQSLRTKQQAATFREHTIPTPPDHWLHQYVYNPEVDREVSRTAESLTIKNGLRDILHISDIHVPFHNPAAIEFAVDYAKRHDIHALVINGDFFDLHDLSEFAKDGVIGVQTEIHYGQSVLKYLASSPSPFETIILVSGNHDERLFHYIANKAPDVLGAIQLDLLETVAQPFENVFYTRNWYVKIGTVIFAHPSKYYSIQGKTVREVSNFFTRYNIHHTGLIIGHTHHIIQMIDGFKWLAETGCMQRIMKWKLKPNLPGPPWTLGFAHIRLDDDGHIDWFGSRVIPIQHNMIDS